MERPQRILFLADINSVHTERWAKLLIADGIELSLFSLSAKKTNWIDNLDLPYQTFELDEDVTRSKGEKSKLKYFKATKEVRKMVEKWTPDIVHAHYATSYGMLAYRLKFSKTVLSLWGSDVFEFPRKSLLHKLYFKRVVKRAHVVCSTSHAMAKEAGKYVQRDYVITPFGTDMNKFVPARKDSEGPLILGTVKSLEQVYGIDRLLHVFSEYLKKAERDAELHIYGKGSQEEELKSLARQLKIESKVFFNGFVQGEDLVSAFQSLDIALMLSRSESFGVAAIESQACGIPTIVTKVGGLPEVCAHTEYVVEEEDVKTVLHLIQSLENKSVRESKGMEAREFVISKYATDSCIESFKKAYDQL